MDKTQLEVANIFLDFFNFTSESKLEDQKIIIDLPAAEHKILSAIEENQSSVEKEKENQTLNNNLSSIANALYKYEHHIIGIDEFIETVQSNVIDI